MKAMSMRRLVCSVLILSSGLLLTACSSMDFNVGDRIDYQNNKSINTLEVPPDLKTPDYDPTYATIPGGAVSAAALTRGGAQGSNIQVLPTNSAIKLMRDGNVRWLQVNAPAEAIWPKLQEFWRIMGVGIKRDEPRVGIMETDWSENRAEIPLDVIRKTIGKVFDGMFDAGSRDRFKIHLERPTPQVTNVYLSHERAEEQVTGTGTKWQYKPAKPELEAELLNRLMVFLQGGNPTANAPMAAESAQTSVTASMTQMEGGQPALLVGGAANDVWIRTGVMLGRIGMSIEEQRRDNGIYVVTYKGGSSQQEKQGLFTRLFKSEKNTLKVGARYQIQIADNGNRSLIRVGDEDGSPLNPAVAQEVLNQLKAEFER